jgi:uncharacterized membrane protein
MRPHRNGSSLPEMHRMTVLDEGAETPPTAKKSNKVACAISGKERPRRDLISLDAVRPSLAERIRRDRPDLAPDALISLAELARFRTLYVEELLLAENGELTELDRQVDESIATHETLGENTDEEFEEQWTLAERLSDHLASFGGSWTFIILFGVVLVVWMGFNIVAFDAIRFDPYPYILLNLVLSTLAAVQAPIIMMSQKRQEAKDRLRSQNDYQVNLKAELRSGICTRRSITCSRANGSGWPRSSRCSSS